MRRVGLGVAGLAIALLLSGDRPRDPNGGVTDSTDLTARLASAISAREYEVTAARSGLQAPNRANGFRTYFDARGARVLERSAPGAPELARLSLFALGHGEQRAPVAPGEVTSRGTRVEIQRADLVEWYENGPEGLEQGFTLAARPPGDGALVLDVEVDDADLALSGGALVLSAPNGLRLRYAELRAADASGRPLDTHLEIGATHLARLVIDDSHASYPLVIDPLLTRAADAVLEGNQGPPGGAFGAFLGFSVASAGDVNGDGYADVIVGAMEYDSGQSDEGAAFVFLGGPNGIASAGAASAAARLESNQSSSLFGSSVSSAGDVNGDGYSDVIVGAYAYDSGETNEGAAFIFLGGPLGVQNGNPATAATVLQGNQANNGVPDPYTGGYFGLVVASAGDVNGDGYSDVLVGDPNYSDGSSLGEVFVFLGSASGVQSGNPSTAATRLTVAAGKSAGHSFGSSVSSAGDVNGDGYDDVIVGAPAFDSLQPNPHGAAFVYLGGPGGIVSVTTDGAATQIVCVSVSLACGTSVAAAGDVNGDGYGDVVIGTEVSALVFHGGASGITATSDLAASGVLAGGGWAGFGGNPYEALLPSFGGVAGLGDVNADGYADVGVTGFSNTSGTHAMLWVFLGGPSGVGILTDAAAFSRLDGIASSVFGYSLAGAGDVNGDGFDDVIFGEAAYDGPEGDEGAAQIFLGGGGIRSSMASASNSRLESNQSGASFGTSVASAGDVNGDGFDDLIVGAPGYDSGEPDEGAAFIFPGGPAGIASGGVTGVITLQVNQASAAFGQSVASAGDVDGDGYADVIVGAPMYDGPVADEGAAFLYLGGPAGIASDSPPNATLRSNQGNSRFGWSVSSAGDVNGDGRSDVIVGAPFYDTSFPFEGAAFVFLGGPGGIASTTAASASATLRGNQLAAAFGLSVASAGDWNGDGYGDVIVGAPLYDDGATDSGVAAVFRGSATGVTSGDLGSALTRLGCINASSQFGLSVSGAGDVNGDGFDDVIVGAPSLTQPSHVGSAFIYAGSASPPAALSQAGATTRIDGANTDNFGASVAGIGDVNGDGLADVAIGQAHPTAPSPPMGRVWLFYGRTTGIPSGVVPPANAVLDGDSPSERFGSSVAAAGDLNGDGLADLVVGAPDLSLPESLEGGVYVFYGGTRGGRPVSVRQLRGDGSGVAVSPWGDALHGDGFATQISASHPAGRGRVRGVVEACPSGVAWGGVGCVTASGAWTTVTGVTFSTLVSLTVAGLPPSRLIHWRTRVLRARATGPLPANPSHGPWRALEARASNESIRTSADADLDGIADSVDNCRYRTNPGQEDAGGFGAGSAPDGIGDVCQCGNVFGDGRVDSGDVLRYRQSLADPAAALSGVLVTRCVVLGGGTSCNLVQVSAIRRGVAHLAPLATSAAAQVCPAALP